jgi:multiple sugar transport system substrate-binding protein
MSHNRVQRSPSPSQVGVPLVGRRAVLKGLLGAAGLAAAPGLAACGGDEGGGGSSGGGDGGGSKVVTFGSNYSDAVPKAAIEKTLAAFKSQSGIDVKINHQAHNPYQENINNYLQGRPDDVWAWFAGYRMQFFAAKGLATPIDDVWEKIGGNFSDAMKTASTGQDGKKYFVPLYAYPWAVFYRKSIWQQRGYQPPKTWDEYKALATKMKADGLTPISLANKDGWPAMGTFDIINMRLNGYQYHVDLMGGKEGWDTDKTKQVFRTWAEILPLCSPSPNGRTWQEGAQLLQQKKAGMHLLGLFVGNQFPPADHGDLDFFLFPEINPEHKQDGIDAPIDGHMLSKQPKNEANGRKLLEFLGSPDAEETYLAADPNYVAASDKADTSSYKPLQKKAVEAIQNSKQIAQFMDRDTRPDFATTVMTPSIQAFLNNPRDIDNICKKIEQQKKSIFTS